MQSFLTVVLPKGHGLVGQFGQNLVRRQGIGSIISLAIQNIKKGLSIKIDLNKSKRFMQNNMFASMLGGSLLVDCSFSIRPGSFQPGQLLLLRPCSAALDKGQTFQSADPDLVSTLGVVEVKQRLMTLHLFSKTHL